MTTLNADTLRTFETQEDTNALPVASKAKIFGGALVGLTETGYARPLQAGDPGAGFATDGVDNSDGADGAALVTVKSRGKVCLYISGLTVADIGKNVYASDDNTFTLTATDNSLIGKLVRIEEAGNGIVAFDFLFCHGTDAATKEPTDEEA